MASPEPLVLKKDGQKRLALLWFIFSGILFFIILFQSILGKYHGAESEVWSWFLPNILPTLSLITSVLVIGEIRYKKSKPKTVDNFVFKLSFFLSTLYLLTIIITVLATATASSSFTSLALLKKSQLWLAPFQGLVSAALGAFFITGNQNF
jgi:heme/copper-type cytochrome/quinol oxidase subunit 3